MPHTKLELLSPAGDRERLEAAVRFGADAVYLGAKQLGMRAAPANFSWDQLRASVDYCHQRGVSVYLTCNVLPTNAEADTMPEFIRNALQTGIDALIVADIGVLMLAKRVAPALPVHISTQAGVVNHLAARELHALGAARVILARELSLKDICVIRDKTPPELEIECFVHGAMCVSFSGRCLLSNYLTGRDGNHGECSGSCRWKYHLVEEKRPGQFFPIFEDEQGTYILNARDLCMLPYLNQVAAAGVTSFKIEGRAKSAYYTAVVTSAYRHALDLLQADPAQYAPPQWLLDELLKMSHREYCTGFYFSENPPGQFYKDDSKSGYHQEWDIAAMVEGYEDGCLICRERNRFSVNDRLDILEPSKPPIPFVPAVIIGEDDIETDTARHPMERLRIPHPRAYAYGSLIRRQRAD